MHPTRRNVLKTALGGAASRRGQAARTAERRRTAEMKVSRVQDDLLEIEQEIADEVQAIDARWRAVGAGIDAVAIRAEAADVTVARLTVVWVPQP